MGGKVQLYLYHIYSPHTKYVKKNINFNIIILLTKAEFNINKFAF